MIFTYLQETHSIKENKASWHTQWGEGAGYTWFSHGYNYSKGVAILFNGSFNHKLHKVDIDPDGRYILMDLAINSEWFILANVYAPNGDDDFLKSVIVKIQEWECDKIVWGGGNDCMLNLNLDKSGGEAETHWA